MLGTCVGLLVGPLIGAFISSALNKAEKLGAAAYNEKLSYRQINALCYTNNSDGESVIHSK